jgi:hypothetical protein
MTDKDKDAVSALRVQRDSAHRQLSELEPQHRWLLKHQADIREWLTDAIQQWQAARAVGHAEAVAFGDEVAKKATALLREAQTHLR